MPKTNANTLISMIQLAEPAFDSLIAYGIPYRKTRDYPGVGSTVHRFGLILQWIRFGKGKFCHNPVTMRHKKLGISN